MKQCMLIRCSSAARRTMLRYVAALVAWALLTASVSAADFTWKFGPGVDVSKLAYGDGIDSAPGNAFYNGSMYFFEDREGKSAHGWAVWENAPALIQGDVHYSSATNAYCSFAFTGTGVRFIADKAANHGRCDVYLDGQVAARGLDLYDTAMVARYAAFHTNGLPAGAHTLKVVVTGSRNDRAAGCQVDVDAFEYVNGSSKER